MQRLLKTIARFLAAEDGPTAVEYAMMILLVFLACLSTIILVGQSTSRSFSSSSDSIQSAVQGHP